MVSGVIPRASMTKEKKQIYWNIWELKYLWFKGYGQAIEKKIHIMWENICKSFIL